MAFPLCTATRAVWGRQNHSGASEAQSTNPGSGTDGSSLTSDTLLNHIVSVSWYVKGERNNISLLYIACRVVFIKKKKKAITIFILEKKKTFRFENLVLSKATLSSL